RTFLYSGKSPAARRGSSYGIAHTHGRLPSPLPRRGGSRFLALCGRIPHTTTCPRCVGTIRRSGQRRDSLPAAAFPPDVGAAVSQRYPPGDASGNRDKQSLEAWISSRSAGEKLSRG